MSVSSSDILEINIADRDKYIMYKPLEKKSFLMTKPPYLDPIIFTLFISWTTSYAPTLLIISIIYRNKEKLTFIDLAVYHR